MSTLPGRSQSLVPAHSCRGSSSRSPASAAPARCPSSCWFGAPVVLTTASGRSVPQVQRQDTLALAGTATAREWRDKPEAAERVLEGPLGSGAPDGTAFCVRVA